MPVSVAMKDRSCLVVGGGVIALRKVESLMEYDTKITVIAAEADRKLEYHAEKGKIRLENRDYKSPEAATFNLVIAATDNHDLNHQVYEDARGAGALVNVVDDPPFCDFIFPSITRRDNLTVSISTDGRAPFMSGHLKQILGNIFPEHWNKLMRYAAEFRLKVRARWPGEPPRQQDCYEKFLQTDWKTVLKHTSHEEILKLLDGLIEL